MRSSTSSSDAAWRRTWASTAFVVAACVLGLELRLRAAGVQPCVHDDDALWSSARDQADDASGLVVLVGSSRLQYGVDLSVLERQLDRRCLQLASVSSDALVILEDLAASSLRDSLVLCELHPDLTFGDRPRSEANARQRLTYRRQRERWRNVESMLQARLMTSLVSVRPLFSPLQVHELLRPETWTGYRRHSLLPTRQFLGRFVAAERAALERRWVEMADTTGPWRPSRELVDGLSRRLAASEQLLRARGNKVVFLRLPSSGIPAERERLLLPRAETWDRLATTAPASFVHFADEPELRGFLSVDGSHLDATAATHFTTQLLAVLRRRGAL